jgi:hypothetical protein
MAKTERDAPTIDDLKVVPFKQWCHNKGISYITGRRLIASGRGPTLTKLGERLTGVQHRHDREWLDRHTVTATAPAK